MRRKVAYIYICHCHCCIKTVRSRKGEHNRLEKKWIVRRPVESFKKSRGAWFSESEWKEMLLSIITSWNTLSFRPFLLVLPSSYISTKLIKKKNSKGKDGSVPLHAQFTQYSASLLTVTKNLYIFARYMICNSYTDLLVHCKCCGIGH